MHLGAGGGQFQHLVITDLGELGGFGNHAGVGGVDSFHVGVDVAAVGVQGGGQRDGGGVGAAAPQRRNVLVRRQPLEPGHDDQPAVGKFLPQPGRVNLADARAPVGVVGADAGLRPAEADGVVAQAA